MSSILISYFAKMNFKGVYNMFELTISVNFEAAHYIKDYPGSVVVYMDTIGR